MKRFTQRNTERVPVPCDPDEMADGGCDVQPPSDGSLSLSPERTLLQSATDSQQLPIASMFLHPPMPKPNNRRGQLLQSTAKKDNQRHYLSFRSKASTGKKSQSRLSNDSTYTKVADFKPKQNPRKLKRLDQHRQGYIWLATYTPDLCLPTKICELINPCPSETCQVQIKDFSLAYGRKKSEVYPFIQQKKDGVIITQIYLIEKAQFVQLAAQITGCSKFELPEQISVGQSIPLFFGASKPTFYSSVTKLCQLENLDVLSLNCEQPEGNTLFAKGRVVLQTPPVQLLASIFEAYMHVFTNYTEHFVLYYLYSSDQVRTSYTNEDLLHVAVPVLLERARTMEEQQPTIALPQQIAAEDCEEDENKNPDSLLQSPWNNVSASPAPRRSSHVLDLRPISAFKKINENKVICPGLNLSQMFNVQLTPDIDRRDSGAHHARRESLANMLDGMSDQLFGLGGKIVPAFAPLNHLSPVGRTVFGQTRGSNATQSELSEMGPLNFGVADAMSMSAYSCAAMPIHDVLGRIVQ